MERFISRFSATNGLYFEPSKAFGVRAIECTIEIPLKESLRRSEAKANRVFNLLIENKIRSIVPSKDFPFSKQIMRYELSIPEIRTLWAKTAGQIASFLLESCEEEFLSVAIYANRVSSELDKTVRYLLPLTRHLAICCRSNAELYIHGLLREFGVSVLTSYNASASADIHLMLQRPALLPAVKSSAIAIQFYKDEYNLPCRSVKNIEYRWPHRIKLPQEYPEDILLAALGEAGAIMPEDISIKNVLVSPNGIV